MWYTFEATNTDQLLYYDDRSSCYTLSERYVTDGTTGCHGAAKGHGEIRKGIPGFSGGETKARSREISVLSFSRVGVRFEREREIDS